MYEVGKKYLYREMGTAIIVTLIEETYNATDKWYDFELRVEEVLSSGILDPDSMPEVGHIMKAGYADGYRHYAGWTLDELRMKGAYPFETYSRT